MALVDRLLPKEVVALRRLTAYGERNRHEYLWLGGAEFEQRLDKATGKKLNLLALSPTPQDVAIWLIANEGGFTIQIRDARNSAIAKAWNLGSWQDEPRVIWDLVARFFKSSLIRYLYAEGRSDGDRLTALMAFLRWQEERGEIARWSFDITTGQLVDASTDGDTVSKRLDDLWETVSARPDWPAYEVSDV